MFLELPFIMPSDIDIIIEIIYYYNVRIIKNNIKNFILINEIFKHFNLYNKLLGGSYEFS